MKKKKYKCAMCGGIFETDRSDEEAMQECIDNFGEMAILDDCDIICDDCYNKINPEEHPEELEKAKNEFYSNPDLKEKLDSLKSSNNLLMKWCSVCDNHYAVCKCVNPVWTTNDKMHGREN